MKISEYKTTKLGLLPDDWEVVEIGEVTSKIGSGSTPRGGEDVYTDLGVVFIRSQNVNGNKLILKGIKHIPTSVNNQMKGTIVKPRDILLNITGASIGRSCVIPQDFIEGNVNQHVCIIRGKKETDPYFLQAFLASYDGQKAIFRNQVGGNREGLNHSSVRKIKIPFPNILEQQKIAKILTTWDDAIELSQKLIKTKEEQKEGLMQRLMTGRVRLSGNNEKWQESKFDDVFSFVSTYVYSRENLNYDEGNKIFNVHYGDIHSTFEGNFIDFEKNKVPKITVPVNVSAAEHFLKDGDLIMADVSEDYAGIGECMEVKNLNGRKALGGLHTFVIRDKKGLTVPTFRTYLFNNNEVRNRLRRIATGSSVHGVSKKNLSKVLLPIPPIEEQEEISIIMINADKEVELLKNKLEVLKQQKIGLMQQLLKGKVRV